MKNYLLLISGIIFLITGFIFSFVPFLQGWPLTIIGLLSIIIHFLLIKINGRAKSAILTIYTVSIIIFILLFLITAVDSYQILKKADPVFCIRLAVLKDGGTEIKYGLFYQVIKWNRLAVEKTGEREISGYLTGTEISYFPNYRYRLFGNNTDFGPGIKLDFKEK